MSKKHGPWTINATRQVYEGFFVELYEDDVIKPDGAPGKYATAHLQPGVTVLALDADGFVHLVRDFRYALGRESVEVVGGAIDEGECPEESARRELKEELGIEAEEWIDLGVYDPVTSIVRSESRMFLARGLKFKEPDQDGSENLRPIRVKLEEAVRMVMENEITHGQSCVLILKAEQFLRSGKEAS